jgi:hypothetical protein
MTEDVGVDLSWLRRGDTVVIEHAEGFTIGRYLQTRQSIVVAGRTTRLPCNTRQFAQLPGSGRSDLRNATGRLSR